MINSDGHKPYLAAVEDAFREQIDYAQNHKIYHDGSKTYAATRQRIAKVTGSPDAGPVSKSCVALSNLTIRMRNC